MADYKQPQLDQGSAIVRTRDGALVPFDTSNRDYRDYLAWRAIPGNTPDPADPPPPPDPIWAADQTTLANLTAQYQALKAGIVTINTHMDAILAGPASPPAAQTGTALKTIAQDIKTTMNGLGMLIDDMAIFVRRSQ